MSAEQAAQAYWAADTSVPLSEETVGSLLRRLAAALPGRAAVMERMPSNDGDLLLASVTYAELYAAADRAAHGLLTFARPGERVGVWAPNSTDWLILYCAVALAGLVLVPVNPALADGEVADQLDRSACVALFAAVDFRGRSLLERATTLQGSGLRRLFDIGNCHSQWSEPSPGAMLPYVNSAAPLLIQYTSGTTGAPKGAVLSHRTAVNVGLLAGPLLGLGDGPVWCNPLPLHHVGASVCVVLTVLAHAGTVVLMRGFDAEEALTMLEVSRAEVLGAVPTMLLAMLEHPTFGARDLSALRLLQIGGATVAPALIRHAETALGVRIVNAYGQSEAPSAAQTRLTDSDDVKALTIGRPGLHREARVVRPDTGETVPFGESGELCLRSPLIMTGYLDDPVQTAATIDGAGWLRTGDLCAMAPDGTLSITGRLRDVIIRGGENVYPTEVENVLLSHPAIGDAAVVGIPDEHWGQQVAAAVRFCSEDPPTWTQLEVYARERLAGFKVPRVWQTVENFPTTASGKIQKFLVAQSFQ